MSNIHDAIDIDKKMAEFKNAVRPLMQYLAEHHHPHMTVIVDSEHAELVEGQMCTRKEQEISREH